MAANRAATGLVLLVAVASAAWATEYTYRLIADNTEQFLIVMQPTSLNGAGATVFKAALPGAYTTWGLFASDGATTVTIADTTESFDDLRGGIINADGMVSFWAHDDAGAYIFKGDGETRTLIADTSGPYRYLRGSPAINPAGIVAFSAQLHGGGEGIYRGDGETIETIVDTDGPFSRFWGNIAFDAGNTLAFWALRSGHGMGIYTSDGETTTTIANTAGIFYDIDPDPDISADGMVTFAADLDCGGGRGVFVGDGNSLFTLADDSGLFDHLLSPAISATGTIAFRALLDSGELGIFTGPDPEADKVIMEGDELFGSTVDGRHVVAAATPIPEPATLCLIALALGPLLARRK